MKTSHQNKLPQCVKQSPSSWQPALLRLWPLVFILNKIAKLSARAARACRAGLSAFRQAISKDHRLHIALWVLWVVAPLLTVAYQCFDQHARVDGWFYINYYYFFFALGPHLYLMATLVGIFLLFPSHSARAWFVVVPLGITTAKAVWLATAQNNEHFHQIVPGWFFLMGFFLAGALLVTMDYITHRCFHEFDALIARIEGIVNVPGLTGEQRTHLLKGPVQQLKEFHSKY